MSNDTGAGDDSVEPDVGVGADSERRIAQEHLAELIARHEVLLARQQNPTANTETEVAGGVVIDFAARVAKIRALSTSERRVRRRKRR